MLPALMALGLAMPARAAQSALSRWLTDETLPQLAQVLASHPRAAGRPVRVEPVSRSGLDEALVTVLVGNLGADERIDIAASLDSHRGGFVSVDGLPCERERGYARLRLTTQREGTRRGRVMLELADEGAPDVAWRRWEWQGQFSREERRALEREVPAALADGSLSAPWPAHAVEQASSALAQTLACDLKPQVRDRVSLAWAAGGAGAMQLGDVFNASRHLLGQLREIDVAAQGDFRIDTRVQPFQDGVVQLWLVGTPLQPGFEPVQAVAYMYGAVEQVVPVAPTVASVQPRISPAPAASTPPPPRVKPAAPARDFLEVQMIDVSQSDRGLSRADLAVQLLLVNRGDWPIAYAFSVSGGHYLHCIADAANFRHDRYGYVEGEIPPGESITRAITVRGVQHKPVPWFGQRKCAGFKDLEGFENFTGKGYKVTEFLRWSM